MKSVKELKSIKNQISLGKTDNIKSTIITQLH